MSEPAAGVAEFSLFLPDELATRRLGAALSDAAAPGMVVLLDGPLGAGKTTLVQGFVRAVGASAAASPSFVLAHNYSGGRVPVWHLDLYRIENPAEIDDLDLDQYLPSDGVALIEWASRAPEIWPSERLEIHLSIEGSGRRARIRGLRGGAEAARRVAAASAPA